MTREQFSGKSKETVIRTITTASRAGGTALSNMSNALDRWLSDTNSAEKKFSPDSLGGMSLKVVGGVLAGAAITAAAGGSWLLRHNHTKRNAQEGIGPAAISEPPVAPVRAGADSDGPSAIKPYLEDGNRTMSTIEGPEGVEHVAREIDAAKTTN